MTKITTQQVRELAELARVGLNESEIRALAVEMTSVLNYVNELDGIDTSKVEATNQVTGLKNALAEDVIKQSEIDRDELLANAPTKEDGFIKVKKVLE
jgi:aspartyl-tRNA(Asn)/glutamyl-tRNA(Gln) amidotransferase subunit C